MIQTEFSFINTRLAGDLEFIYDIEAIRTEDSFANLLVRDEQLAHYYIVARLLGEPMNQWEEMQFTFTDLVISCKIARRDWGLQLKIKDAYFPASLLDIEYREGMRAIRIPKIADNIHIKQVEGYEFKSKMLAPLEIDTKSIVYIDDDCLKGIYLHSPFLCSNKKNGAGYNLKFDCISNYMENCTVHNIKAINILGIEKFLSKGNRVEHIHNLFSNKYFSLDKPICGVIKEEIIYNFFQSVTKLIGGTSVDILHITLNRKNTDSELLAFQLMEMVNAFSHLETSIQTIAIEIKHQACLNSYRYLVKDSDNTVSIRYNK